MKAIYGLTSVLILAGHAQTFTGQSQAKSTTKPAVESYSGCVTKLVKVPRYVLASGDRCILLSGAVNFSDLAGHRVELLGSLREPIELNPLTLEVSSARAVSSVCSITCTLPPPGTRGIHGSEKPGSQGGTAGVTSTPPQAP